MLQSYSWLQIMRRSEKDHGESKGHWRANIPLWLTNVFAPTLLGGLIYLSWRSTTLVIFRWLEFLGFSGAVQAVRAVATPWKEFIPGWVLFSLPDALWSYAFTCGLCFVWASHKCWHRFLWIFTPLILSVSIECLQASGFLVGTFDWIDFCLSSAACILALILFSSPKTKNRNKRNAYLA